MPPAVVGADGFIRLASNPQNMLPFVLLQVAHLHRYWARLTVLVLPMIPVRSG